MGKEVTATIKQVELHSDITPIKDALNDFFSETTQKGIEDELHELLISDIGKTYDANNGSYSTISDKLYTVTLVLTFLRKFPALLTTINLDERPELIAIKKAFDGINYNEIDEAIFSGLNQWIYQEKNAEYACIEYIARISVFYKYVVDLFELCDVLNNVLSNEVDLA